jgi:ATP-dependent DNA helicase RecQ
MQQYFGEKDAEPCGICDLCLRRKKESELTIGKYKTRILELIETNPVELRDLVNTFSMIHKSQVIEILRHLESEKKISINHEMISRYKP